MIYSRTILLSLIMTAALAAPAHCQTGPPVSDVGSDAIVAEVNGEPITHRDLEEELSLDREWMQVQRGGSAGKGSEAVRKRIKERALEMLIDDILVRQAAKRKKIALSPEEEREFERRFTERIKEDWGNFEAFEEYLRDRGVPLERQKSQVRNHFIMQKLLDMQALSHDSFVRPADIRAYYAAHREEYRDPGQVVFSHIDIPFPRHPKEEARRTAEEVLKEIQAGKDFAEVARARSEGVHAETGGEWKVESFESLTKELAQALRPMKPGEVSGVLELSRSFTILKLQSVQEETFKSFEAVEEEIERKLEEQKRAERHQELLTRLRADATIKRRLR